MTMGSPRNAFGKALVEAGERRKDLVVLTADVADATRTKWFAEKFPNRFINVGISEQAMIDMCAGLSAVGFLPLASAFAMFLMRAWEQVRNMVCRAHVNVKIVGTHAGFADAGDGSSHQSLEDVALMRTLPCMTVVVPADPIEVSKATHAIIDYPTPVYMRIGRDYGPQVYEDPNYEFVIGKGVWLRDGHDYAIIGNGPLLWDALQAAKMLERERISVAVINMHTVKPLDTALLDKIINKFKGIVTIEEHGVRGGLGSSVAEYVVQNPPETPIPIKIMGAKSYGRSARDVRDLIKAQGLDSTSIINTIKRLESKVRR